ncbi:hypothetical protein Tcan_01884 [Toxocara canis]|uniref:Uncharacterized protein n=1 Tax=Toxocara canis TaxID=6265 RepID=A0A0B2W6D8_TOXCA|nr:hypothetical protein Tcan_01884 [Toxocara canis]
MDAREEISRSRKRRRHDQPKYEDNYIKFGAKKRSPSFLLKLHHKLMKSGLDQSLFHPSTSETRNPCSTLRGDSIHKSAISTSEESQNSKIYDFLNLLAQLFCAICGLVFLLDVE